VLNAQWGVDTGELTPTMKLKRKVIHQKFAKEIEELYA
jgi:long-chain acyl-CoA synthetase